MEKDLIIDVNSTEVSIALLENHKLIELNKEQNNGSYAVGDVYLGKVKRIMPALNAAFVDIGDDKDAFIHYLDLGLAFRTLDYFTRQIGQSKLSHNALFSGLKLGDILEKEGKIADVLKPGQSIVTQIVKEPISTKGSRLTAEISIAGRNMVLIPFIDKVNISQKITSKEEKKRLERLVYSILPPNYGVIIRTAAEGKKAAVLDGELKSLIKKWEDSWPKMAKANPPQLLFTENSRTTTILRDLLNDSFSNIYINDETICNEVKDYITLIAPEQEKIVKLYKGGVPIFDHFDISKQIRSAFGKVITIKQGAYLIIEHTEALHVIDVNSGIRAKSGADQEQNAFEVNMNAAEEISRQLRLRDMGGIIIVDFIDMDHNENRVKLYKHMQDLMQSDRAKHNILPITRFGLMQITRQRVRPATEINTSESCPTCNGTGKISSSMLIEETIERQLAYYVKEKGIKAITIKLNPILSAYLTKGIASIRFKLAMKYKCTLKIKESTDNHLLEVLWYNMNGEKLED
ncbi:MAG: Rne/Rng family ribonuclease [Bacteroidales bacterium]|jgi:ribonuclease G|nr:Rne/Rng family ribonuclease [Bacteroidales bacterium]MDD4292305.1 Rne/Rng family ribonuclease [Bacteroidales bacterium]MDD4490935.1 Rne/Rng family ribonuclease [Bacteroidales bacterium]HNW48157.1 Rne/Rng family ribonuclease [Bacteroidales bacterium]HPS95645.1 Rne/Rng family ribonuclease [Bacteroidales bacterium]